MRIITGDESAFKLKKATDIVSVRNANPRARAKPIVVAWMAAPPEAVAILRKERVRNLLAGLSKTGTDQSVTLSEYLSKRMLKQLGFTIPCGDLATTVDDALNIASTIGYPVVAKLAARGIAHKSDMGAVKLGLESPASLRSAVEEILANSDRLPPEAEFDGILIEEMLPPSWCSESKT
jgi:acyl-CoA synthetase (NDP forming)